MDFKKNNINQERLGILKSIIKEKNLERLAIEGDVQEIEY